MNDFFTNLLDRHLGTCETIQPRTLGRFEEDRGGVAASFDQGINLEASENNQTPQPPQPPDKAFYEPRKEATSEFNPQEPVIANRNHSIDLQGAFSVETPTVTIAEPGSVGHRDDSLSSQPGLTAHQTQLANPFSVLEKPDDTQTLSSDGDFHSKAMEREQQTRPHENRLIVDDHGTFSENPVQANSHDLDRTINDKHSPPVLSMSEYTSENDSNHRIQAMLQRLTDDSISPATTVLAADDQGSLKNENQLSIPAEKKASLPNAVETPPEPAAPTLKRQDKISAGDGEQTPRHEQLEPPPWLRNLEPQFKSRLQEAEVKPEPVINVTIGRVEVRATQSETPKNRQGPKKPSGVMTLDEYLKRREGGGQR